MQLGVPQLENSLLAEPTHVDKQAVDHTRTVIRATGLFGRLDDFLGDDAAMRLCDLGFLHLARNALCYKMPQAKADLGNLERSDGGGEMLAAIVRQDFVEATGQIAIFEEREEWVLTGSFLFVKPLVAGRRAIARARRVLEAEELVQGFPATQVDHGCYLGLSERRRGSKESERERARERESRPDVREG